MVSEAAFKTAWQQTGHEADLLLRAFISGQQCDCLSWVFVSAYQSALRRTFGNLPSDQWWSFAASEDRTGELPGVTLNNDRLSGSKTWIAGADHVDGVVVTCEGSCYLVSVNDPGVSIETDPPGSFLPDMSVGKLTLTDVSAVPVAMHGDFSLAEPFFLVAASCGYLVREAGRLGLEGLAPAAESALADLSALQDPEIDTERLLGVYMKVAGLGKTCGAEAGKQDNGPGRDWKQNGRLLSMYRKGLQQRVE